MTRFFLLPDQARVWLAAEVRRRHLAVERAPNISGCRFLRASEIDDGIGADRPNEGGWVFVHLPTVQDTDLLLGEIGFRAHAMFPDAAVRARHLRTTLSRSVRRLAVVPVFAKDILHGAQAQTPSVYASPEAIAEYREHLRQKGVRNIIYVNDHAEPSPTVPEE